MALTEHSGGLLSRQLEMADFILEQLKDLGIIFMRFLRVNQIFEKENKK